MDKKDRSTLWDSKIKGSFPLKIEGEAEVRKTLFRCRWIQKEVLGIA